MTDQDLGNFDTPAKDSKPKSEYKLGFQPNGMPNSPGRSTAYRPEYCDQVIQMGIDGFTVYEMASAFKVHKSTLYYWQDKNAPFSDAFHVARQEAKVYLIQKCKTNIDNGSFNMKVVQFLSHFIMDKEDRNPDAYVHVPGFNDSKDPTDRLNCVMDALGARKITPKEAQQYVDVVSEAVKCMTGQSDVVELMNKLTEQINILENSNGKV
jgi:hypothetical protein